LPQPISQNYSSELTDDKNIADSDTVIRSVKTDKHIAHGPDGDYVISPQIFTSQGSGCSAELLSLLEAAGQGPLNSVERIEAIGAVSLTVADIRSTFNRYDPKTKIASQRMGVAYTPLPAGEKYAANPFHCDIIPRPVGGPGRIELFKKKRVVVPIDQAKAALLKPLLDKRLVSGSGD
jgi:hypothetical protein